MIPFAFRRIVLTSVVVGAFVPAASRAQEPTSATMDVAIPPGNNYDKAEFRLWFPPKAQHLKAILLLVPGSNGDGRAAATDTGWQAFATKHDLALVALHVTDKPHDQGFIEDYVNVSQGSGQALLSAIDEFAQRSQHPELSSAPFLLWGMSAGGEWNYEFTVWKPERVVAFVVNKGNIYYTALAPRAARMVPGILFVGGKDLAFRVNTIAGIFAVNRRGGALWAFAEEPSAGHIVGRSRDVATVFFEDALAARLDPNGGPLKPADEKSGFIGDLTAKTYQPVGDQKAPNVPTAWLLSERVAKGWQAMMTESPWSP